MTVSVVSCKQCKVEIQKYLYWFKIVMNVTKSVISDDYEIVRF